MSESTVSAQEIEVAGEIIDEFTGKRWAVPVDNCDDLSDRTIPNPLAMPEDRRDPRFEYQWIRENQWTEYSAIGCVRVTRQEFNGEKPHALDDEYGTPVGSYVEYEGAIMIKMPKHVFELRQRQQNNEARLAMQDVAKQQSRQQRGGARGTVEETEETVLSTAEERPRGRRR